MLLQARGCSSFCPPSSSLFYIALGAFLATTEVVIIACRGFTEWTQAGRGQDRTELIFTMRLGFVIEIPRLWEFHSLAFSIRPQIPLKHEHLPYRAYRRIYLPFIVDSIPDLSLLQSVLLSMGNDNMATDLIK